MLGQVLPHIATRRGINSTDFGSATIATMNGNGWTFLGGSNITGVIEASSASLSGKRARMVKDVSDGARFIMWNQIAAVADLEILVLMQILSDPGSSETTGQILARADATDGDPYYICLPRKVSTTKKIEIGEGDGSGGGAALLNANKSWDTTNYWWQRFRLQGTALKGKMWQFQTAEPTAWDVETTDGTLASGRMGFGMFYTSNPYSILWLSVATGGNTAPSPGG